MEEKKSVRINDGYQPAKSQYGYQPANSGQRGYQPISNNATRPNPPKTGSVVNQTEKK